MARLCIKKIEVKELNALHPGIYRTFDGKVVLKIFKKSVYLIFDGKEGTAVFSLLAV